MLDPKIPLELEEDSWVDDDYFDDSEEYLESDILEDDDWDGNDENLIDE